MNRRDALKAIPALVALPAVVDLTAGEYMREALAFGPPATVTFYGNLKIGDVLEYGAERWVVTGLYPGGKR